MASWQGMLRRTGGAEVGEVPWLINFHLGDTLGIFPPKESSKEKVGVF